MAVVHVNGHLYYTHSVRRGCRVTSMSYGPVHGEDARRFVAMDRIIREKRRTECMQRREDKRKLSEARQEGRRTANQETQALRERLDSTDRLMAEYSKRVAKAVEAHLTALGYHRHDRGEWRRRRTPMLSIEAARYPKGVVPLTQSEQLAGRARAGDLAALETVLQEAARHHHETVEGVLLQQLAPGDGPPYNDPTDSVSVKMAMMRGELAPPGSSPAEKLLAERAALCWLHMELLDYEAARLFHSREVDSPKAEIIDRRLGRVQARFSQALTDLAKIRRLNVPLVINQVNVGARVNGVQIAGDCAPPGRMDTP
jgi:hypothetical protein